jgi:hypothetical protein
MEMFPHYFPEEVFMKNRTRPFNLVLVIVIVFSALGFISQPAMAEASDLFFSEYIEGSSYNKALEIFNGTGAAVDLAAEDYTIKIYFNGSISAATTIDLVGIVADGDVFVVADDGADPAILAATDQQSTSNFFNGDDAVELLKGGVVVDAIGQVGYDPGSQWGTGDVSTQDNTIRRLVTVCQGDPDSSDAFDITLEWEGFAQNTFDGLGSHIANCGAVGPIEPVINEFSASTTGTDVEFIEFFGEPETDYSAYTLLEIEGDSGGSLGVIDEVISLGATDTNGLFLVNLASNSLENGSISLLLVKDFTGALGDDIDTDDDGVIDVSSWSALVDSVAANDGGSGDLTYGVPTLYAYYDGLSYAPGGASRIPDGYDTDALTDWVRNDFDLGGIPGYGGTLIVGEAYNTPGAPNMVYTPPPEACGDSFTPIYEIQGNGMSTPIYGDEVATEGIVVADYQEGGKNGFFIQDIAGDGDPATSDGIFVYTPGSMDVMTGDHVRVRGYASEYYDLTQVSSVSQIWICDIEQTLPDPVALTLPVMDWVTFEPYEGMRVIFPQDLVISEYFNFDRYGEIVLTSTRHLTPTAEFEPGSPEAYAAMQAYLLDSITLDDGSTSQNPDPALHPDGMVFDLNNLFRGGGLVTNLIGVLDYGYGIYRIQPTHGADYTDTNPRTTSPDIMEGDLKIASLNVYNYFTTIDDGSWICGPSGDMECRGADNADELTRQRAKILAALSGINADVVGLMEIENDRPGPVPDYSVADLVAGLNDLMGAGTYDYIPTGAIGTDAIKVALIYKPAKVTPIGSFAVLDSSFDPLFLDNYNRPVLAATFMDNLSEEAFTVAVNHLKSKGSDCNAVGDPDLGDGAGNCNITRTNAAMVEVDWLASDPTGTGVDNFILIGDLNSYDKEDPVDAIKAGPDDTFGTGDDFFDMLFEIQGEAAYSYVFDGQIGYLDYALANANFAQYIDDVNVWHINADEPDLINYDTSFKKDAQDAIYAPDAYRSSDHDPVVISLTFDYHIVDVDIKPGSCENPVNEKSKGVIPVAILGTADFDVTQIDPASITLAGVAPLRWSFEDVSATSNCSAKHGDGYLDLVLHFDTQELVFALGEVVDGDMLTLKLVGSLLPDYGSTPVIGYDTMLIP